MDAQQTNDAVQLYTVGEEEVNKRLDAFLTANNEGWSRTRIQKLIENGDCTINGKVAKSNHKLRLNEIIEVELSEELDTPIEPEDIPIDVVFEDDDILVVNKNAGLVVHTGAGVYSGTLSNAVAFHCKLLTPEYGINYRFGIVHRLDKLTSGLIVVAKNIVSHENLSEQFREREVFKSYLALVHGNMKEDKGKVEQPIARDRNNRTKMTIAEHGRYALSLYKVRERFDNFTLLDVQIKTGRTHQIRVHLASLRHGVVGDEAYNNGRDRMIQNVNIKQRIPALKRFFLHAEQLTFKHPKSGELMKFQQDIPQDLQDFLELIKQSGNN
jgi:23S rRNA pseudouridine1911/1915/1917 synthase